MPGLLEEPLSSDKDIKPSATATQNLPKGIVLDKDGKPCRTCTSSSAWMSMMKQSTSKKPSTPKTSSSTTVAASATAATIPALTFTTTTTDTDSSPSTNTTSTLEPTTSDCPPDVEVLGRSTWTLLHSLTATYPPKPTAQEKSNVSQFLTLFSQLYPCWVCAEDFRDWMGTPGNEPRLSNQEEFGRWMCRAHNAVNVKLGKQEFNCDLWRERWRDGWRDGRCG